MQSYNYARRSGVECITWVRFAELARTLVEKLAPLNIEAVVGTARAGLFPATAVCLMLRRELYPMRVSRRVDDEVKFQHPQWIIDIAPDVKGKVVAVVDFFGMKEMGFLVEREVQRFMGVTQKLIFKLVHLRLTS